MSMSAEGLCALQGLDWEFVVINEPVANAFVMPGGKVVVFRGLLDLIKSGGGDDDDELAAVLAHEVAHVLARHTVRGPGYILITRAEQSLQVADSHPADIERGSMRGIDSL